MANTVTPFDSARKLSAHHM